MNRPTYETAQDRSNERKLASLIERTHGCMLQKMPIKLHLDYMATRDGRAVAFIEMKQRKTAMRQYPTYMLSLLKAIQASAITQTTGLPCFLAVQWSDAAGICKLPPDHEGMHIEMGGTTRRGDPQDIEPVLHFNIANFKELKL